MQTLTSANTGLRQNIFTEEHVGVDRTSILELEADIDPVNGKNLPDVLLDPDI